jgi:hypothetical protein
VNTLHRFELLLTERITHSERRAVSLLLVLNGLIYLHLCLRIGGLL